MEYAIVALVFVVIVLACVVTGLQIRLNKVGDPVVREVPKEVRVNVEKIVYKDLLDRPAQAYTVLCTGMYLFDEEYVKAEYGPMNAETGTRGSGVIKMKLNDGYHTLEKSEAVKISAALIGAVKALDTTRAEVVSNP